MQPPSAAPVKQELEVIADRGGESRPSLRTARESAPAGENERNPAPRMSILRLRGADHLQTNFTIRREHFIHLRPLRGRCATTGIRQLPQPLSALPVVATRRRPSWRPGRRLRRTDAAGRSRASQRQGHGAGALLRAVWATVGEPGSGRRSRPARLGGGSRRHHDAVSCPFGPAIADRIGDATGRPLTIPAAPPATRRAKRWPSNRTVRASRRAARVRRRQRLSDRWAVPIV